MAAHATPISVLSVLISIAVKIAIVVLVINGFVWTSKCREYLRQWARD
jgi:hypothetical protein